MLRSSFGPEQRKHLKEAEEEDDNHFIAYPYRWVIMVLFFMPNMMNGMSWITFSSVSSQIESAYDVSQLMVTMTSLVYLIFYIIINFPSNYLLQKSLTGGIWIGTLFTIGGGWVRMFLNYSFWWALVGQILGAIGQPFIFSAPTKIAAVWFKPKERPMATAVLALINSLGISLGFLFPSFFVDSEYSPTNTKDQIYNMLFWQAIIMTASSLPTLFFFREKPPTPPSHCAEQEKMSYKDSFSSVLKNKNYVYLLLAFGFAQGNFTSFSTLIDFYDDQYNFTSDQSSYFGFVFIMSGLVGSGILSKVIEKTSAYKKVMAYSSLILVILYGLLMYLLTLENFWVFLFGLFIYGFFVTPLVPIGIDYGCEITFPVSEPFSSGLIITIGQVFGIIQIVVSSYGIDLDSRNTVMISLGIGMVVQVAACFFYSLLKDDLKRQNEEIKAQNERLLNKQKQNQFDVNQETILSEDNNSSNKNSNIQQ